MKVYRWKIPRDYAVIRNEMGWIYEVHIVFPPLGELHRYDAGRNFKMGAEYVTH